MMGVRYRVGSEGTMKLGARAPIGERKETDMIVDRSTAKAKGNAQMELAALLKSALETFGLRGRVYTSFFGGGETNRVVIELEFENMAALEKFWDEWPTMPGAAAFNKKLDELAENVGNSREMLRLQ
jgi:hypothetical protein